MKTSPTTLRIGIAVAIIVGTIAALAYTGIGANQSYYVKIGEVLRPENQGGMGDKAHHRQLRVEGFVVPGSIEQNGTNVTFMMNEYESHSPNAAKGRTIKVVYKGSEPPPDTFKDDSQALAMGTYGYDGVIHANVLQAKCASKYAPAGPNGQPGVKPAQPATAPAKSNAAGAPPPTSPAS
jgi:cytochrome c-type biogenesis protein CcmE